MTAPGVWTLEDPATPSRFSRSYVSEPVEVIGSMRPVMKHGQVLENRNRRNPPNPLSLKPENRR